jgi:hypothetical protein
LPRLAGRRLRTIQENGSVYNGQVHVDTNNGVTGVVPYENGTSDNPTLTWAEALVIAPNVNGGLSDFHIINGSSITLTANTDNKSIFGDNYSVNLGNQSCADIFIQGAAVSGIGTAATGEMHFDGCNYGIASVQSGHFDFCAFADTITHTLAGNYQYHNCYSGVAGAGAPTFTKTPAQTISAEWRNWAGGITVSNIEAGDVMTVGGTLGTVTLNGSDGTVEIRGTYKAIVDNRTGSPTLNTDGAINASDVAAILDDTGTSGVLIAPTGLDLIVSTATGMVEIAKAVWDRIISKANHDIGQSAGKILRISGDIIQIDGAVSDVSPTSTSFDTNLTQVDGYFDDALLVFVNGSANAGISKPVSAYVNASGNMTFLAPDIWPVTPVNGDDFVIYANHVHPLAQITSDILAGGDIDGYTLEESQKIQLAALAGKLSGAATATEIIRAADDSKARITATVDAAGNRTAITIDETG